MFHKISTHHSLKQLTYKNVKHMICINLCELFLNDCKSIFFLILFSSIWSDVFPVRWPTVKDAANMCQNWMKLSPSLSSDTLSTCPCTLRQALRDTGRYFVDPLCNLQNDKIDTNCLYNKGAAQCFRRSLHG